MLPTCPACKQSVLDDDAENCPFCGANMKTGKGGGTTAVPKPAAKATPKPTSAAPIPVAPAPKASAKPSPAKAAQTSDDDDPFGVDAAVNIRAIPLSPRPAKGKTLRLICPMCETPGFAGPEVAGKEVKCCNEQCALPIFTAPKGDPALAGADPRVPAGKSSAAPAPTAKKVSPALLLTVVGTLALAIGSVWYFMFDKPPAIKPAPAPPPSDAQTNVPVVPTLPTEKVEDTKVVEKSQPLGAELRAAILPAMVDLSRVTEKNRSKHFCRRLTADALIEAGDLKGARENIDQLLNLTPRLPFHQVPPLTQIAWHELAAGNADAAKAALDQAVKAATNLPAVSRLTFDATTDLAAALFVAGRRDEAKNLMKKDNMLPSGSSGALAAVSRRAHLLRNFDFDEAAVSLPLIPWNSPAWVVTTMSLVLRGHADQGTEWIKLAPDAETQADCWAAWGDCIVSAPNSDAATKEETIAAAVRHESPATQARVWARVAVARGLVQQKEAALKGIANAVAALQSVPLPPDFVLPDMKEMLRLDLADATAPRLHAIAAAEVARAQTLLNQTKPAGESLAAALQHLRGHAPSPVAARRLFEATSRDSNAVKAQLKKALDLKTDDKVQQAFTNYRAKCKAAFDAANARFTLQTEILKAAVDWPLVDAVWTEATARAGQNTPDDAREEFLKTNLAVRLGQRLRKAGKIDQARRCENEATTGELVDPRDALQQVTAELAEKGNVAAVAQKLITYQPPKADGERVSSEDTDWTMLWGLRLACRLAKAGKTDQAFDLVSGFKHDMTWREEGYELLAALAGKDPTAAESIWKKYRTSLLTPTEKIAVYRGLCAGLSAALSATP